MACEARRFILDILRNSDCRSGTFWEYAILLRIAPTRLHLGFGTSRLFSLLATAPRYLSGRQVWSDLRLVQARVVLHAVSISFM